ncbi:uncharacterized protein [Solanum lycopersicum]|uniref:uncharacterized protein n=1 Tax=Solanum lycopersicum TaxID=4081 RepID=UPI00374970AA
MGDNNDEVSLTDIVVAQPTVAEQNELIAQLMQQIAEMRVEMQRRQDTPPSGFGPNFIDARPPIIILLIGAKFAEIVKDSETIADGVKSGKIARVSASSGSSGMMRKNREEVALSYRAPSPTYQVQAPAYQNPLPNYQALVPNYQTNSYPRTQAHRPNARNYQQVTPPQQSGYDPSRPSVGHDTEDCINLKHKIQDLIDQEVVSLQPAAQNVNTNPLPNHGGENINMIETDEDECETKRITPVVQEDLEKVVASLRVKEKGEFVILTPMKVVALVPSKTLAKPKFVIETAVAQGMTRSGRCYTPDELALGGQKKDHAKRPISEAEAEEFWRRIQPKDYSIVKHLEKNPAQISVWDLLRSSWSHRKALMKAEDDTYVPSGTSSDNVASMIHQVIRGHRIIFCNDELPAKGRSTTKLYRPFIHIVGDVPSTLHQMMKLVCKNEELFIHGERSHSGKQVPVFYEMPQGLYLYTVELINASDEDLAPQTPMPAVYRMIATVMLQKGFEPGFGLGRNFQGIIEPVPVLAKGLKYGLGNVSYRPANVMSCHELSEQNETDDDKFENQQKSNLEETEMVNLGDSECVKEVKTSTYLNGTQKESLIHLLAEYSDVFVWEVGDMQGLSTDVISHKLPINPGFEPVKQKTRKFKPELSLKIMEEITKQIESRLVEVKQYLTWFANAVTVAKKDGKIRICVDYRDLNKASPKDNFPLPNIRILIDS